MNRRRAIAIFIGLIFLDAAMLGRAQSIVWVDRSSDSPVFVVNSAVTSTPLTGGTVVQNNAVIVAGQYVYFAVSIQFDVVGMSYLRSHGALPIYEVWDAPSDTDRFDVGIDSDKWALQRDKLEAEFKQAGQVTWRTYGRKRNVSTGKYSVSVRDANNHPFSLGEGIGESYNIIVTVNP